MSIRFLCNLLLVVCFLCNVSDFSYLYADPREQFSVIWRDPSKIDVASDCLRQCISDEKSLLNITKHLIGHGHILDISETQGKLSADFLFILSDPNIVSYLKFLRGIYNIRNDGTNGHPMGALFSLKFGTSVSSRLNALKDMRNIFTYGLSCTFIKEQCEVVLSKISELSAILEMSEKLELASRSAFTFQRQLTKKQEGALRNLDKRIPREIDVYKQAGLNTATIKKITATSELIQGLREDPQPLIDCIAEITEVTLPDISKNATEIESIITKQFFETPILDEQIKTFFVKFTVDYLQNFLLLMSSVTVNKNTNEISKNIVGISFEKLFSGEEFKKFVLSSLKKNIEIAPPEKNAIVLLILKSVLDKASACSYSIDVSSKPYDIMSTYIATFFPYTR